MESSFKQFLLAVGGALLIVVLGVVGLNLFEHVDADEIVIIQSPVKGELAFFTDPGVKWQGFGSVTRYKKRNQFWFSSKTDQGTSADQSLRLRFNDGGHATVSGSLAYELPLDSEHLRKIREQYPTPESLDQSLVRTVIEKATYMSGPIMSSNESYSSRRPELLRVIEDQIANGVYDMKSRDEKEPDPITGQPKTVKKMDIVVDTNGHPKRVEASPLAIYGVKISNLSINEIKYDPTVEAQIKQQQQMTMAVQTSLAEAKQAEQRAITAAKNGEAKAAEAKWEQEVIKAKMVTEAQQKKEVAKLDMEAAGFKKQKDILEGEGEAAKKRLVMQADGALTQRLGAYVEVNKAYAEAIAAYTGAWVPTTVMGASAGNSNGATNLVELLTAKTARELSLDMTPTKHNGK